MVDCQAQELNTFRARCNHRVEVLTVFPPEIIEACRCLETGQWFAVHLLLVHPEQFRIC